MKLDDALKKVADSSDSTDVSNDEYGSIELAKKREELRQIQIENEARAGENLSDSQDRDQRKDFAERIFSFVALYMFAVFFILTLSGGPFNFRLSDNVLITLLGTTTANVIGILIIVVTYLFSRKKK